MLAREKSYTLVENEENENDKELPPQYEVNEIIFPSFFLIRSIIRIALNQIVTKTWVSRKSQFHNYEKRIQFKRNFIIFVIWNHL